MGAQSYPSGIDCSWVASDRDGNVAILITAGCGPIPVEMLQSDRVQVPDIEDFIWTMPSVTEACLSVSVPRPDAFIGLAERGLFVYDWTDLHRTLREALNKYERVATPAIPIKVDHLPGALIETARAMVFANLLFADQTHLTVVGISDPGA